MDTNRNSHQLNLPILWYATPLVLILILPKLVGVNLLQPRYLLFAYPATYLILARVMLNVKASEFHQWLPTEVFIKATLITASIPAMKSSQTFARWPSRAWNDALAKLAQLYQSRGIIVAQVGLIEADLLADNRNNPLLISYLSWPLLSRLPALSKHDIAILPYRLTDQTQINLNSLVKQAIVHRRVWPAGRGNVVSAFHERLTRDFSYKITRKFNYFDGRESAQVRLLERIAP